MRLIDADAVIKDLRKEAMELWGENSPKYRLTMDILGAVRNAPTIQANPATPAQWKGYSHPYWKGEKDANDDPVFRHTNVYVCSRCHWRSVVQSHFCPNCGSAMQKEVKQDD